MSDWPHDFQAVIEGDLRVSYYDTEAGLKMIQAQAVPARSWPSVIKVCVEPHQEAWTGATNKSYDQPAGHLPWAASRQYKHACSQCLLATGGLVVSPMQQLQQQLKPVQLDWF